MRNAFAASVLLALLVFSGITPYIGEGAEMGSDTFPTVRATSTVYYNRTAAWGYAYRWWNDRNPHYQDFTSSGGDCANFVSQCLIAGGLSLHKGTDGNGYGVYPDVDRPTTYSNGTIPFCDYLHQHLINYQPVDYAYVTTSNATIPSWIEIGDVVIFGDSTDYWQHAMIVVWVGNGDIGLAGHTTDAWNVSFWTEMSYFSIANFYHIRDRGYDGTEFVFVVKAGTLNVRVGPGLNGLGNLYQDIGDIYEGQMYVAFETVVDANGNLWYHFWYDDRAAWCAAQYSGNVYAKPVNQASFEVQVGSYLNVRTGPGTTYTDIGEVYDGMRFYTIARALDANGRVWRKFWWGGQEAWCAAWYTANASFVIKNLTRVNIGFYPYWVGSYYTSIPHEYISHIAWFSIDLNSDGTVANYNNWPTGWTDLVAQAHENGTRVMVTATLFGSTSISTLLGSATYRTTAVNNIVDAVVNGNADGAMIDFETPPSGSGADLVAFMQELRSALDAYNIDYELAICLSPYPWSTQVWGDANLFPQLNQYVDYYFLMGYDYHWSGSSTTGAVGALFWESGVDGYNATLIYLGYGASRFKFVYGVPYFGYDWPVSSTEYTQRAATTTASGTSRSYNSAMSLLSTYGSTLQWDSISQSPWFWYYDGTDYRQVWFDNATSLKYKYELVNRWDLAGMGIWALGYDSSTQELWNAIGEKVGNFSVDVIYPAPGSLIGGTVNATVLVYGGVTDLYYRVPGGTWTKAMVDVNLHATTRYIHGVAYGGYQSAFHLTWDTNSLLPGNYTLELRANNSYGHTVFWNFTYTVARNAALEGLAWGSPSASALNDDQDYLDAYGGYAANDLNAPLYLELPCNFTIRAFKFRLWDGDGRYYQYRIEVSQDNITWTEVVNRTTGEWRGWQWASFAQGTVRARYIRFNGTYNSANQWYHIVEFKVFVYEDMVLHGKVLTDAGLPLANASLRITDENNGNYINVTTDAYGNYEVDLTPLGFAEGDVINVSVVEPGYTGYATTTATRLVAQKRLDVTATAVIPELSPVLAVLSLLAVLALARRLTATRISR